MLERQLDLLDAVAGADRVHGHPDLHPEAVGERQHVAQHARRASPAGRRSEPSASNPHSRLIWSPRVAERDPEASALAPRERGDREVALATLDRLDQGDQLARRLAEVAVAEQDAPRPAPPPESSASAAAVTLPPLPCGRLAADHAWPRGCIATSAVPSSEASSATTSSAPGIACRERVDRVADPVGLVAGGDHRRASGPVLGVRGTGGYCARAMADIEAHITGTVWKIEVKVGDDVSEGDTVVILESMKMEMPVEAEDDGKVAEIRCEEGQSVSEGDVLVVLE